MSVLIDYRPTCLRTSRAFSWMTPGSLPIQDRLVMP